MGEVNPTLMFVLQALLAVIMMFFGFILNGMRASIREVNNDLKLLNNSVLGNYITRTDFDSRWKDQRTLDHELRAMIQQIMVEQAELHGKPYTGPQ